MTCTPRSGPRRSRRPGAVTGLRGSERLPQEPAMEADRERAVVEERVVERAQVERSAEPALLVIAELEKEDLAEEIRQLVCRRVGVAIDLGPRVGRLEARVADEEVGRLVGGQLAPVHPDVEN